MRSATARRVERALAGFVAGVGAQAVQAQSYGSDNGGVLDRLMQTIGVEKAPDVGRINYTERSPLVVPPTRDLPPPVTDGGSADVGLAD